jgi:type IV secretory pathway VirB2 component (pilin)
MKKHKRIAGSVVMKRFIMLTAVTMLVLSAPASLFAQEKESDAFGLNARVELILQVIGSPWVKGIACVALVAECIGLLTAGRQEPGMFKKFVPWIAGTLLFLAAGTITNKFMAGVGDNTFSSVLTEK